MQNKPKYAEEEERCHFCQFRAFAVAKDGFKMAITNDVDDALIDPNFRFIDKSVYGAGVEKSLAEPGFQAGCACQTDSDCAHDCDCLGDLDEDNIVNPNFKNAYYTAGPRKGLLREELLQVSGDEIYECSDLCSCSKNCPNRVVGRGRRVDIEVFRTNDGRGFGQLPTWISIAMLMLIQEFVLGKISKRANSSTNIMAKSSHQQKPTVAEKWENTIRSRICIFSPSTNSTAQNLKILGSEVSHTKSTVSLWVAQLALSTIPATQTLGSWLLSLIVPINICSSCASSLSRKSHG